MIVYDVDNVTKVYPRQSVPANKDISLQIHRSETYDLLGDSGTGKTTLDGGLGRRHPGAQSDPPGVTL